MKFESGDYVIGKAQLNKKVMLKGVIIQEINSWSALVSYFDERKKPQFRILFHPQLLKEEPPNELVSKAKENPYWGKKSGEEVRMKTNV